MMLVFYGDGFGSLRGGGVGAGVEGVGVGAGVGAEVEVEVEVEVDGTGAGAGAGAGDVKVEMADATLRPSSHVKRENLRDESAISIIVLMSRLNSFASEYVPL